LKPNFEEKFKKMILAFLTFRFGMTSSSSSRRRPGTGLVEVELVEAVEVVIVVARKVTPASVVVVTT
jgi:hypothetical protein